MTNKDRTGYLIVALIACLFGVIAIARPYITPAQSTASVMQATESVYLAPESLEAQAAVLYDPETGAVLFGKNQERQLPLASLTKLATATLALDAVSPSTIVVIRNEDLRPEGDSGLHEGERWQLLPLVRFTLRSSSNDGAAAIARAAFPEGISDMNLLSEHLGLAQTYFLNPTGLDVSTSTSGAYGSALDIAKLLSYVLKSHPEALDLTVDNTLPVSDTSGTMHESIPTSQTILDIPGLIGAKTGFTDLAGGNLAVAFDQGVGHPLVAVVLGSSREGRFNDIRTLIRAVRTTPQ